ncbi:MAG: dTMP kinase [Chthonomonas sp.]|nr:dTMP kinase [Chthonomonas sp.]
MSRGKFITFEGVEGAGKSSVLTAVAERLTANGQTVIRTREPGNGQVGSQIRNILLHSEVELDVRAEIFLFMADRAQHMTELIQPALERGDWVLCDRHADSTVVYQGYARGFDIDKLHEWNAVATQGKMPDLTVLLDLNPETGLTRQLIADRLGGLPLDFHVKVRNGFLKEMELDPVRFEKIDASQPLPQVIDNVYEIIRQRFGL